MVAPGREREGITGEIFLEGFGVVTGGVTGDEEGLNVDRTLPLPIHRIQNLSHLVQLLRTNIRTTRKAKVNLHQPRAQSGGYQSMFPLVRILSHVLPKMIH
jgi:hypothetical protein